MRRALLIAAILTSVLLVAALGWWRADSSRAPAGPAGGDFTLVSADGPVSLADFRGKVVLLYFGYASCPDVCPTALAQTAQGLAMLSPEERARVRVVFVSVDPERDTPAKLKRYTAHFAPDMIGVSGSAAALADVAARYGAAYRKTAVQSAVGYVVDHTAFTSVIAPDGRLVEQLPHGTSPAQIAQAIRHRLRG